VSAVLSAAHTLVSETELRNHCAEYEHQVTTCHTAGSCVSIPNVSTVDIYSIKTALSLLGQTKCAIAYSQSTCDQLLLLTPSCPEETIVMFVYESLFIAWKLECVLSAM
jgi:hypothetical protein